MTEKSEIDLLYEAAAFCGFKPADGWPAELNPRQLAALMAGGWKEPHKQAWRVSLQMIADAIKAGSLTPRRQSRPPVEIARDADDLSEYARFSKAVFPSLDSLGRARLVYYEKREQPDTQHIDRNQCAAWLRAIKKAPSEYVRAWLGPVWQEEAPKVGAGKTAPQPRAQERRDRLTVAIEAAMSALQKKDMPSPTAGDVFDYLAESDETGTIEDSTDEKLIWRTSEGHLKDTSRKSLANRLTGLRKKSPV